MNKIKSFFSKCNKQMDKVIYSDGVGKVITSLWCALIGLFIGFIILLIINPYNAGDGMMVTIKNYFIFSQDSMKLKYLGSTLAKTAPLIAMSLSILFSLKAGLFNIGASGQFQIAVVVITVLAFYTNLNWFFVLLLGMIAAGLYGAITGLLKAYFNVNEVISGIMLNWISLYLANGVLQSDPILWDSSNAETYLINSDNSAFLPQIGLDKVFFGNNIVGLGIIIALIAVAVVFIVLKTTSFGYEVKAIGLNPEASKYAGMNNKKIIILSTFICGALAGLCASLNLQNGYQSWKISSVVVPYGFDGISSAFLGGLNPIGIIFSSYFITHIKEGGSMLTDYGYAPQVADIITASIIYLSSFASFIQSFIKEKDAIKAQLKEVSPRKKEKEKK